MSRINIIILLSIITLVSFVSCSNEFELNEPKVETPIVYGLINADDAFHYIRLERAFADPATSALELAKRPDSLYYKNAVVKLQKLSVQGQVTAEFILQEVDGNLEGLPREDGIFATSPNLLYKLSEATSDIEEGDNLRLNIDLEDGKKIVAEALMINKSTPTNVSQVTFNSEGKASINWRGGLNSVFHTVDYIFHITEQTVEGPVKKDLKWRIVKDYDKAKNNQRQFTVDFTGIEFYNFMATMLVKDASIKRYMDGVDLVITSGGQDLYNYVKVGQANLGITSSGEIPFFTNLTLGRGVFSSRSVGGLYGLSLSSNTYNELKENSITKDLNFQ